MKRCIHAVAGPLLIFFLTWLLASCAGPTTSLARFQAFSLKNEGIGEVTEVHVEYGDFVFPVGYQSPTVPVPHITNSVSFTETASVKVPETAKIAWRSADGKQHTVITPIRALIVDWSNFRGFVFVFKDNTLVLRVEMHRDSPPPVGELYYSQDISTHASS